MAGVQQADLYQVPGVNSPLKFKPVITGVAVTADRHVFIPGLVGGLPYRHGGRISIDNRIVVIQCGKEGQSGVGAFKVFIGFVQRVPPPETVKRQRHDLGLVSPEVYTVGCFIDIVAQVDHEVRVVCNDVVVSDEITVCVVLAGYRDETDGFSLTVACGKGLCTARFRSVRAHGKPVPVFPPRFQSPYVSMYRMDQLRNSQFFSLPDKLLHILVLEQLPAHRYGVPAEPSIGSQRFRRKPGP